jgi:hypothetical protein
MRFMVEESVLVVRLDEKDWLELEADIGFTLYPDVAFAEAYISSPSIVQRSIIRLAAKHCPADDQDVVRLASTRMSEADPPFTSILVFTKRQDDDDPSSARERMISVSLTNS